MKFDPTMTVPPDVAAAADKLTNYFANRGITDWRLNGVASRAQLEQAEADRDAFEAAGESARERLVLRMEELQQAVQARLAAEKERDQLLVALKNARTMLHTVADCSSNECPDCQEHAGLHRDECDAAIAAVKGGAQ